MIELPDDELDKLFRKSSEELDPQFDPEDWDRLRKRLDETDGKTPATWFRKWWPLGVLAVLIPVGIVLYRFAGENGGKEEGRKEVVLGENGGREKGRKETGGSSGAVGGEKEVGADLEDEANFKKDIDKGSKDSSKNAGESSSESDLNAAFGKNSKILPRSLSKAGGVYLEPNRSKREGGDGALPLNADEEVHKNDPKGTSASELGARQATGSDGVTPNAVGSGITKNATTEAVVDQVQTVNKTGEEEAGRMEYAANSLDNKSISWNNRIPYPAIFIAELKPEVEAEKSKEKVGVDNAKWAVRFGYSPDLSTVGLKNFTKPGSSVSLLAEYSIVSRLYLQTGAVWSSKGYYGEGKNYQLPLSSDPHYYGPEVKSVDGICKVLEIPFNLRYDVFRTERSMIFAGSGVSSYHMNKEKYKYSFENEKDPKIKSRGWQGKTGWYWFSHLNVSAGYEHKISPKLSILAEPYLRVPLKRVGYGKVNLFTTGMWLSLRYTPAFR